MTPEQLTWAKVAYNSPSGQIRIAWKHTGKNLTLEVDIPEGITAEIWVPGSNEIECVQAGQYTFQKSP